MRHDSRSRGVATCSAPAKSNIQDIAPGERSIQASGPCPHGPVQDRHEDIDGTALTYAEVKAIASGNPMVIEKASIDAELARLTRLHKQHHETQYRLRFQIRGQRTQRECLAPQTLERGSPEEQGEVILEARAERRVSQSVHRSRGTHSSLPGDAEPTGASDGDARRQRGGCMCPRIDGHRLSPIIRR